MSVWNPDNIIDVAESVGIGSLQKDVVEHLARDVEYRLSQVLEEALKFMRHGKRTTLSTQDISQALRLLDVEPLYGYESTRPLRFGEASIGPGQPLYYVEDEDMDFEKLINAPLPPVPREMSFTAHWLAVEGVQPSIAQNPTQAETNSRELTAKGPGANQTLAALSGGDNVAVKPLVKHVLSKELQLYFDRISAAVYDVSNEELRVAALASLRTDPGIHQLLPYFTQLAADKVTHQLASIFTLTQSLRLLEALLANNALYLAPYIPHTIPTVLTCMLAKHLGNSTQDPPTTHLSLRSYASSLLASIARTYASTSSTLKPRLARACLSAWLDTHNPWGTHYGAILGLTGIAGPAGVRSLLLPHLSAYSQHLQTGLDEPTGSTKRLAAEEVLTAILTALQTLETEPAAQKPDLDDPEAKASTKESLVPVLGEMLAEKVLASARAAAVAKAVLETPDGA